MWTECTTLRAFVRAFTLDGVVKVFELRLRSIGKSGFRILQSNEKSENGFHLREIRPQGGLQLRNPNPHFNDFIFTVRLGDPKNKTILLKSGLLFANYACPYKTAVLKDSFQILFRPNRNVKRKSKKDI